MRTHWWMLALSLAGCSARTIRYHVPLPTSAQALSFLGDTIWSMAIDPASGPTLIDELLEARADAARHPRDIEASLLLASRTADLGRVQEAIGQYTLAMVEHPIDPRPKLRRAELFIIVRQLDIAIRELQSLGRYQLGRLPYLRRRGTLHLGFAYYLKGQYEPARLALQESLKESLTTDEAILAAFWLFLATKRAGYLAEAREVLDLVTPEVEVQARHAELALLRAFRGDIQVADLPIDLHRSYETTADALYAYGVGVTLRGLGRDDEAVILFERIRRMTNWTTWPYLAAEQELAQLATLR